MKNLITIDAVTSSALGLGAGVVAVGPRYVAPLSKVKGTGLPVGGPVVPALKGTSARFGTTGAASLVCVAMGTDQAEQLVRIPVATVAGTPPRRTPHRC